MRFKAILKIIGRILLIEGVLLLIPLGVSLFYREGTYLSFLIPSLILIVAGILSNYLFHVEDQSIYARDGFFIVGISWVLLSLFGCLPFIISGEIPNFIDALFETVSGFTTTGASILSDVEVLSKGIMFWRLLTHWVGGMGILVFVLAIMPNAEKNGAKNIYILRAESTGPQVGKLVSKVNFSARILYLIYISLTVLEICFLLAGKNNFYDSVVYALSTAGTGGFATVNNLAEYLSTYSQIVIAVFMFLFGINFNIFFLLLLGKVRDVLKSEELWWYIGIVVASVAVICLSIFRLYDNIGIALKDSFFQVASIITTTGFSTADFDMWPSLAKYTLIMLMFVGACAGSTGGGLKVSRVVIMFKSFGRDVKTLLHPNAIQVLHMDGKPVEENTVNGVKNYFYTYVGIIILGLGLISINGLFLEGGLDFETTFSSVVACMNNIGPGFSLVGPTLNYGFFSSFSKIVFIMLMLIGRLEIYPILLLFSPRTYKK